MTQTPSRYPHLLEPFRLRHVTFRNRLMSMSHAPGYVEDKHPPPHLHRGDALCLHGSATGREWTMPHVVEPGPRPQHEIVVMGAGPATPA